MAKLQFGLENFTMNTHFLQSMDELSIAIESEVSDIEFREVKKEDSSSSKPSIGERVKTGIAKIIAWFREKIKRVGQFLRDMYYKSKYLIYNASGRFTEIAAKSLKAAYDSLIKRDNKVDAEKIKSLTVNQYLEYIYNDIIKNLKGSKELSIIINYQQLSKVLLNAKDYAKSCWQYAMHNKSKENIEKYLELTEKENDEFERVLQKNINSNTTSSSFIKSIDVATSSGRGVTEEALALCNAITKDLDKSIEEFSTSGGDVARVTSTLSKYVSNVLLFSASMRLVENIFINYLLISEDNTIGSVAEAYTKGISQMLKCHELLKK